MSARFRLDSGRKVNWRAVCRVGRAFFKQFRS